MVCHLFTSAFSEVDEQVKPAFCEKYAIGLQDILQSKRNEPLTGWPHASPITFQIVAQVEKTGEEFMINRKFSFIARVSTENSAAIRRALKELVPQGSISATDEGFLGRASYAAQAPAS